MSVFELTNEITNGEAIQTLKDYGVEIDTHSQFIQVYWHSNDFSG